MKIVTAKSPYRITVILLVVSLYWAGTVYSENQSIEKMKHSTDQTNTFSLVELYTSQGCSSCPPADALLREIIHKTDVSGLSLHVDYWNYIGWVDPHSKKQYSYRQHKYQRSIPFKTRYTPQMIINGKYQCLGSDASCIESAVSKSTAIRFGNEIQLERNQQSIHIQFDFQNLQQIPDARLFTALVIQENTQDIKRGENSGKKLTNYNIAATLTQHPRPTQSFSVKIPSYLKESKLGFLLWFEDANGVVLGGKEWKDL